MMTDNRRFLEIIDSTPLVSIDLILEDRKGSVLLGKRVNRPAQGYWFVPGGRITKNERLADAIKRISSAELGITISIDEVRLLGAFEHFYSDNYLSQDGINTHYVVLAYKINARDDLEVVPDDQHSAIQWWPKRELLSSPEVHNNTKAYFTDREQVDLPDS